MVKKYIILSDCSVGFDTPRQLTEINGEPLIKRTIRLLKENGVNDILITSHDKRFDDLGATRYEPLYNDYVPRESGYWLNAFPSELLNEPICFLFGDVYYSENAIKTIVNTDTKDILFFCTYKNKCEKYIKHHDEPLAFKVVNYIVFKEHIERVKDYKDKGLCVREPITWELYRSINGQDINAHIMTKNYVAINDESCDIDSVSDIMLLKYKLGGIEMIKVEVIEEFTLEKFDALKNIVRKNKDTKGRLYVGDIFECDKEMADYLLGNNAKDKVVVKLIEVKKEEKKETEVEFEKDPEAGEIKIKAVKPKKKTTKKITKK